VADVSAVAVGGAACTAAGVIVPLTGSDALSLLDCGTMLIAGPAPPTMREAAFGGKPRR
jgi:hypothetical protein